MHGIHMLRRMAKSEPDAFARIKDEYYSMKTRAFCTKHHIGVTGAVALFGRKKPPKKTLLVSMRDLEEVDVEAWREMRDELDCARRKLQAQGFIPNDADDYYAKYGKG